MIFLILNNLDVEGIKKKAKPVRTSDQKRKGTRSPRDESWENSNNRYSQELE